MFVIDPTYLMWVTLLLTVAVIVLYASEKIPLELTSLGLVAVLLIIFHVFPVPGPEGENVLDARRLLEGFANPALIAVVALLVMGQGMVRTGALDRAAQLVFQMSGGRPRSSLALALVLVLVISAFINNTPVVVIFIPIMQVLSERLGRPASSFMMPLSFAAILGGMTTLIGSSTNLLVASSLIELGQTPFDFFSFTIPGVVLAAVGLVYVLLVAPRFLPDRATLAGELVGESGRQFIAQITVPEGSPLVGERAVAGLFPRLRDITVRMIQRGEHAELPPFDDFALEAGDVLIVAATRKALTDAVARGAGVLAPELKSARARPRPPARLETRAGGDQILAEVMVTPASRLIGQNLEQIGFRYRYNCIALGIQRRSRMIRARMTEIPLEAGDVLLVQGRPEDVEALRANRDILPMEWSATELPSSEQARTAGLIFLGVVVLAALGVVPIVIAAVLGAAGMIAAGALNIRQAARAIDRRIVLLVGAALALGAAMQETGAASFVAHAVVGLFSTPAAALSAFFLAVALLTNVLSNNACAVLFTPIAISLAQELGVDPMVFAVGVVFAANSSFASPIGYQTNLLVMGPGHYRFPDYARAGLPLTFLLWAAFSLFAPAYYGI